MPSLAYSPEIAIRLYAVAQGLETKDPTVVVHAWFALCKARVFPYMHGQEDLDENIVHAALHQFDDVAVPLPADRQGHGAGTYLAHAFGEIYGDVPMKEQLVRLRSNFFSDTISDQELQLLRKLAHAPLEHYDPTTRQLVPDQRPLPLKNPAA